MKESLLSKIAISSCKDEALVKDDPFFEYDENFYSNLFGLLSGRREEDAYKDHHLADLMAKGVVYEYNLRGILIRLSVDNKDFERVSDDSKDISYPDFDSFLLFMGYIHSFSYETDSDGDYIFKDYNAQRFTLSEFFEVLELDYVEHVTIMLERLN